MVRCTLVLFFDVIVMQLSSSAETHPQTVFTFFVLVCFLSRHFKKSKCTVGARFGLFCQSVVESVAIHYFIHGTVMRRAIFDHGGDGADAGHI